MFDMTKRPDPNDFVVVRPLDGAEFILRVCMIDELNEAWDEKPALIFITNPTNPSKKGSIPISGEEYDRIKYVLTGEMRLSPADLRLAYEQATKDAKKGKAKK